MGTEGGRPLLQTILESFEPLFYNKVRGLGLAGYASSKPYDGILYHYTTAQGLHGILKDREIFATHYNYLNDISELKHGLNYIIDRLSDDALDSQLGLLEAKANTANFDAEKFKVLAVAKSIAKLVRVHLQDNIHVGVFVTSFCKRGNLLNQWRCYGGSGGYSIGFRFSKQNFMYGDDEKCGAELHGLLYKASEQKVLVDAFFSALMEILGVIVDPHIDVDRDFLKGLVPFIPDLCACLVVCCTWMKHSSFRSEREMRLSTVRSFVGDRYRADDIHFRQSGGLNVPYLKIPIRDDYAKIVSVRCGPTLQKDKAKQSVEMMLKRYSHENVKVTSSAIPLGW